MLGLRVGEEEAVVVEHEGVAGLEDLDGADLALAKLLHVDGSEDDAFCRIAIHDRGGDDDNRGAAALAEDDVGDGDLAAHRLLEVVAVADADLADGDGVRAGDDEAGGVGEIDAFHVAEQALRAGVVGREFGAGVGRTVDGGQRGGVAGPLLHQQRLSVRPVFDRIDRRGGEILQLLVQRDGERFSAHRVGHEGHGGRDGCDQQDGGYDDPELKIPFHVMVVWKAACNTPKRIAECGLAAGSSTSANGADT